MGRILVEIDIHLGLLETLDIQWRDQLFSQRMDYLGLPFRCTLCRKTGHLRSTCQGIVEEEDSENTRLRKMPRSDSLSMDSYAREEHLNETLVSPSFSDSDTLTGKLKSLCPIFFYSLTSWEKLALDVTSRSRIVPINLPCLPVLSNNVLSSSLEEYQPLHLGDKVLTDPLQFNLPREDSRMFNSATTSSLLGTGSPIPGTVEISSDALLEVEEGGKETYILSGYRQDNLGDISLGETLDSLVPLLCEVESYVLLTTFQGKTVITLMGSIEPSFHSGNCVGGVGHSYAWSRGLGYETLPIKTRSACKKATLTTVTLDHTTTTVSDTGVLRGLKSLA
jgi:hypothetical protein